MCSETLTAPPFAAYAARLVCRLARGATTFGARAFRPRTCDVFIRPHGGWNIHANAM
jgi:hypothetical protein